MSCVTRLDLKRPATTATATVAGMGVGKPQIPRWAGQATMALWLSGGAFSAHHWA